MLSNHLPRAGQLLLLFLLTAPLLAQEEADTRRIQWATAGRFAMPFGSGPTIEPAETGSRLTTNILYEIDYEARFNEHWSAILVTGMDFVWTRRDPTNTAPGRITDDPEFVTHPFTSTLNTIFLRLGGQYSYRIGRGDFSAALSAGPGFTSYTRSYDYLRVTGPNLLTSGVAIDEARPTFTLVFSARMQYTHWFARKFALTAGIQGISFRYQSGAVDTPDGPRYQLEYQESAVLPVRYNVNYDITSLTPDPRLRKIGLNWFVGVTQRL